MSSAAAAEEAVRALEGRRVEVKVADDVDVISQTQVEVTRVTVTQSEYLLVGSEAGGGTWSLAMKRDKVHSGTPRPNQIMYVHPDNHFVDTVLTPIG